MATQQGGLDGRWIDRTGTVFDLVAVGGSYQMTWRNEVGAHRWMTIDEAEARRLAAASRRLGDVPRQ